MSVALEQNQAAMNIERIPVSPHLGLELRGVDLTRHLDEATQAAIRDAWIDAGVLLFRGMGTSPEVHMRLSQVFGEMEPAATASLNDPDNPYLMILSYHPGKTGGYQQHYTVGGVDRAGWLGWHWDQSFMPTIVRGAVLRMVEPAALMGETGFIDAVAAYDRLSAAQKKRIEGLEVVYEFNPDFTSGQFGFPKDIQALGSGKPSFNSGHNFDFPPVVHPLVITQRETGRKVLKLSPMHARYVLGMDHAESDALLTEIADHLVDPRYAYFHVWGKDDLIVWDNWRVIHSANGVPLDCARVAQRTTIVGDYKVGRYLDASRDRTDIGRRIVD
jgi:taurine dioxygenase